MMINSSKVAGRPKIKWLAMVACHSPRIAELSMPATTSTGKPSSLRKPTRYAAPSISEFRDRVDHAFPALGHRLLQSAPDRETGRPAARRRVTGEIFSTRLHQRKEASRAAPDQRVEVLEVARQHRDRDDAVE